MKEEIWKDVPGPEDAVIHYQVSNHGRVRRLSYTATFSNQVTSWEKTLPDKILKGSQDSSGYLQVKLYFYRANKREWGQGAVNILVHRLVAEAFLPPPSKELIEECAKCGIKQVCVNHKDGNPLNNAEWNLEWCTVSYNNAQKDMDYSYMYGSKSKNSVLTEKDVDEILRLRATGLSQQKIADIFGVKQITISNILTGRSWAWYTGIPRKERNKGKRAAKTKQLVEN